MNEQIRTQLREEENRLHELRERGEISHETFLNRVREMKERFDRVEFHLKAHRMIQRKAI
jgi:hypothetical protein